MCYLSSLWVFSGSMSLVFRSYPQQGEYESVWADISSFEITPSGPVCQRDFEGEDGDMDGADLAVLAENLSSGIMEDFAYSFWRKLMPEIAIGLAWRSSCPGFS